MNSTILDYTDVFHKNNTKYSYCWFSIAMKFKAFSHIIWVIQLLLVPMGDLLHLQQTLWLDFVSILFILCRSRTGSCDDMATMSTTRMFNRRESLLLCATLSRLNYIVLLYSRGVSVGRCSAVRKDPDAGAAISVKIIYIGTLNHLFIHILVFTFGSPLETVWLFTV